MKRVELIYDSDCPNVDRARSALRAAFARAGLEAAWSEWNRSAPEAPAYVRRYGSPTIRIDGRDVAGLAPGDERPSCRIYDNGAGSLDVVPSVERIVDALRR